MSNEERSDITVAGFEVNYPDRETKLSTRIRGKTFSKDTEIYRLVRKSYAEKAVQKARKEERQQILDKIEDKIRQVDRIGEQYGSEMNADMIKNELEELRDDLQEGEEVENK